MFKSIQHFVDWFETEINLTDSLIKSHFAICSLKTGNHAATSHLYSKTGCPDIVAYADLTPNVK